ncbi:hypothetical protein Leryth_000722 [Lithospermum erythrorhizon]|uniref:RWP-RK domain-containing protein n=1 Tax=Lithospermum erythrorhizon TaxID=34254 RepID=A0AAV3RDU9_LITER|nr:hypothetical protein Leryth_000722 [Lithospermum erythrorhizon]
MVRRNTNTPATTSKNVVDSNVFDDPSDDIIIPEDYDPSTDPVIWSFLNESPHTPFDIAGPSYCGGETSGHGGSNVNTDVPQSSDYGRPMPVPVWPIPPSPYNCSCCQTLREIIHTNGRQFAKFEIHGRLGLFCHAVLDKYENAPSSHHEYQMFDFCRENIINIKKFLIQYCQERQREGYQMLKDPLHLFYDALVVGLNFDNPHLSSTSINSGYETQPGKQTSEVVRLSRSPLAEQRERTGKLELRDLATYFHLPIEVAAKEINVCPTVIKKICRRYGLGRWPYRKVNSISKKITERRQDFLFTSDAGERARIQADIQQLEQELRDICSSPSMQ